MCEPLSTTASILAVAGVAAKSCECLYNALRLYSEAPKDLQHHINAVQALQSIFADIAALEKDLPNAALITPDFKARLQACMLELQAVERLAKSFYTRLEEGRARRTWAKMRWSSADQRQALKRYLSRIESYHKMFSLDLLLLNIRLSLSPAKESLSNQEGDLHPPDVSVKRTTQLRGHKYSLRPPQEYFPKQVSLRSSFLRCLESNPLRLLLWLGPITVQQWHNGRSLDSDGVESGHGYGIALATTSQFYCPFRFELIVSLMSNWKGPNVNFSVHWNLFCPSIVPWNASIVDLALRGDVDAMKREFSFRNSTPFDVLPGGLTLLHLAASHGHFDMVKFLLQEGARVNAMNDFGETPLHSAVALSKNYNIARVLIENGGDLHNRNADGKTPLHTFPSQVSEQLLRCHGYLLDFSTRDHRGMTLLHYLAWSSKTSDETFKRHHERNTFSLSTVDTEGRSMLHLAAQRGNVPVVEYLICAAKDFNINHSDNRGRTVLHYGVENKRACDTVTALISHGADIWARDCHERSALHHAAKVGNLPAVKALLTFGMVDELRAADYFGMTPLEIAAYHKAHAVLTFLSETENRWEWGKQPTGPSLIEYRDLCSVEMDSSIGTALSTPEPTRYGAIPARVRPDWYRIDRGWKSLLRTLQRHQWRLNDLNTYYCAIKFLAVAVVILTLLIFLT